MAYAVHLYPRAVEHAYQRANDRGFFENAANLIAFDASLVARLEQQLALRGFTEGKPTSAGRHFKHAAWPAEALLTKTALYLSATGDGIFEIGMFASETADGELAKFDPQDATWE